MIHPLLTDPNPALRAKSRPLSEEEIASSETQTLINDLTETMYAANGIGLAAPQIGVSRRIIIVETGHHEPLALINPELTKQSFRCVWSEEGCLSVPGVYGIVKRHRGVTITALDRNGNSLTLKNNDLVAIILQHEIDHLNGILFIDRAKKLHQVSEHTKPKI